ncbi:uncharacterized protein LOC121376031 [Gigantopelta aegis]|uniref:uncharacterized protein LOC121376031 n=1 Tax=Gigantopelta aegis TaxID=1735272 RepID=UPI001B88E5EE|nr:uncharacterized protein LOC121376031 [Gigantopelta aegis]
MGTSSSKKKRKTGSGKEHFTGVRHGTLERDRRERKRSLGQKTALGWTKSGPVLATGKTVVYERKGKASTSQALTPTLSTSLRYSDFNRIVRKASLEIDDVKPMYIPYDTDEVFQDDPDDLCHICSVYTGGTLFTCRVCLHVYHESCLRKIGQDGNSAQFRSKGHWSCHICDDVSGLLTEEEMERLCQTFEKYNIIKGRNLLHEEILSFWKQQFLDKVASGMDLDTERRLVDVICKMDADHRGLVAWKNFLDHEALKILNKRNKNSLLRLLKESEIREIRNKFKLFDYNKQGYIMKDNALALLSASEAFYCIQECGSGPTLCTLGSNSQINWQQFLMMQAIYSIAARLNLWENNYDGGDHIAPRHTAINNPLPNSGNVVRGSQSSMRDTEVVMRDNRYKTRNIGVPLHHTGDKTRDIGVPLRHTGDAAVVKRDNGNARFETGDAKRNTVDATGAKPNSGNGMLRTKDAVRDTTQTVQTRKVQVTNRSVSDSGKAANLDSTRSDVTLVSACKNTPHPNTRCSFPIIYNKPKVRGNSENTDTRKFTEPSSKHLDYAATTSEREKDSRNTDKVIGQGNMDETQTSRPSCVFANDAGSGKKGSQSQAYMPQNMTNKHVNNENAAGRTVVTSKDNEITKKERSSGLQEKTNIIRAVLNRTSNGKDTTRASQIQLLRCTSVQRATKSLYGLHGTPGRRGHTDLRRPVSMA